MLRNMEMLHLQLLFNIISELTTRKVPEYRRNSMRLVRFRFTMKTVIVFIFFRQKYDYSATDTNTEILLVAGRGLV
jgi:hypothetical protein